MCRRGKEKSSKPMRASKRKPVTEEPVEPMSLHMFMTPLRQPFVSLMLCAYFLICIGYAIVTPFGRAPDENAHHFYVRHIVERGSLPKMQKGEEWHEAHQPPLFYILASPLFIASKSLAKLIGANEGDAERATVWVLRIFCMLCGSITVLATFHVAKLLFPNEPIYANTALAFAATHAMHAFINSSINSDNFAEALCSIFMVWLLSTPFSRSIGLKDAFTLGLFLGCIGITKYFAWSAVSATIVVLFWNVRRYTPSIRELLKCIAITCVTAFAICSWWYIRNIILYGDPLGQRVYEQLSEHAAQPSWFLAMGYSMLDYFSFAVRYLYWTFWGLFGLTDIFLPGWAYYLWLIPTLASAIGLLRLLMSRRLITSGEQVAVSWLSLLCWLITLLLLYIAFLMHYFSAQMRHLFLMFAFFAVLFAAGLIELLPATVKKGLQFILPIGVASFMLTYNALCIFLVIPGAYK
ncbi:MAG: hypothetical protein RUDDFDWM_000592 [Candidatus Fervidibacterota bacterium]